MEGLFGFGLLNCFEINKWIALWGKNSSVCWKRVGCVGICPKTVSSPVRFVVIVFGAVWKEAAEKKGNVAEKKMGSFAFFPYSQSEIFETEAIIDGSA